MLLPRSPGKLSERLVCCHNFVAKGQTNGFEAIICLALAAATDLPADVLQRALVLDNGCNQPLVGQAL